MRNSMHCCKMNTVHSPTSQAEAVKTQQPLCLLPQLPSPFSPEKITSENTTVENGTLPRKNWIKTIFLIKNFGSQRSKE